ncbi:hypothetical protein P9112_005917 [Eukaryota sp. TZLM1-RC]
MTKAMSSDDGHVVRSRPSDTPTSLHGPSSSASTTKPPSRQHSSKPSLASFAIPTVQSPSFGSSPKSKPSKSSYSPKPSTSKSDVAAPPSSMPPKSVPRPSPPKQFTPTSTKPATPSIARPKLPTRPPSTPRSPSFSVDPSFKTSTVDSYSVPSSPRCPSSRKTSQNKPLTPMNSLRQAADEGYENYSRIKNQFDYADQKRASNNMVCSVRNDVLNKTSTPPVMTSSVKNVTSLQSIQNIESLRSQNSRSKIEVKQQEVENAHTTLPEDINTLKRAANFSATSRMGSRSKRGDQGSIRQNFGNNFSESSKVVDKEKSRSKFSFDSPSSSVTFTPKRMSSSFDKLNISNISKPTMSSTAPVDSSETFNSSFSYRIDGQASTARRSAFGFRPL